MKKVLYITILAFLILGMLVQVIPASARAVKTPVSIQSILIGFGEQPNLRVWGTGHNDSVFQYKNMVFLFQVESTDPRLSGYSIFECNANVHSNSEGVINANNSNCKETIYINDDFTDPIWSCQYVYTLNGSWQEHCQGVGINKGLKAFFEWGSSDLAEGYILETEGE